LYKLNPVFADKLINGCDELPPQAYDIRGWRRAKWELWEEAEGLILTLSSRASSDRKRLVAWTGNPKNLLEVEELPTLQLAAGKSVEQHMKHVKPGEEHEHTKEEEIVKVEVIDIPEEHKEAPTEFTPFVVKWEVDGKKKCFVVGCEDEMSCSKWVANLKLYSNIGRRHCGAVMWKMNQSAYQALPKGEGGALDPQDFGDLRQWRRRLCNLEVLKLQNALCITYVSEKSDAEECVANVLASVSGNTAKAVSSIRRLPPFTVKTLDPKESEKVLVSIEQYEIAVANQGHNEPAKPTLPTTLHAFEVRQSDDSQGGQMGCIFALEDSLMAERWLAGVDSACHKLTRDSDSPALRLIEA